jgi:hypothetical protein
MHVSEGKLHMKVLDDIGQWQATYEERWLAHYRETGEMNWRIYNRPTNGEAPAGPGVELSASRLLLITSSGAYLPDSQEPFVTEKSALGDYTIRQFAASTPLADLAFAHGFYDHTAVDKDPQVLVPLAHLDDLVSEGVIGELAPTVISFCGFQPDVVRTLEEFIPAVISAAKVQEPDAAFLVPA